MIWDILFWAGLAYLVIAVIWRFIVQRRRKRDSDRSAEKGRRRFGIGATLAVIAILAVGLASLFKAKPDFLRSGGSEGEKVEMQHFLDAVAFYDQATEMLAATPDPVSEDWETICALLEASLTEARQVSNGALDNLHGDLRDNFREKFMAGLRTGIYGLRAYNRLVLKPGKGVNQEVVDSISRGRELLDQWVTWYDLKREAIEEAAK